MLHGPMAPPNIETLTPAPQCRVQGLGFRVFRVEGFSAHKRRPLVRVLRSPKPGLSQVGQKLIRV